MDKQPALFSSNCKKCNDHKKRLFTYENGYSRCFNCGFTENKNETREKKLKRILFEG